MPDRLIFTNHLDAAHFILPECRGGKTAVLVDENTKHNCYPAIKKVLPAAHLLIEVQSGEAHKNLASCRHIWQKLTDAAFDRKSLLINLGGGVVGDMGGFCAATYKRGIAFIQLPTTLLAQVDAGIGGKLGIDFRGLKNHIGLFGQANRVIIYPPFLHTLPKRERRSGYAEVLKHALVANQADWKMLSASLPSEKQDWEKIVRSSAQIKQNIVAADPAEKGLRKILNFGHTIGHAVESFLLKSGTEKILHGEAVALGMICESYLSHKTAGLSAKSLTEISDYLRAVYGKVPIAPNHFAALLELMKQDKKNNGRGINFSLLRAIGEACFDQILPQELIQESLHYYLKL